MDKQPVSIFNDAIGPVMRGPSSSHSDAAARIGKLVKQMAGGDVWEAVAMGRPAIHGIEDDLAGIQVKHHGVLFRLCSDLLRSRLLVLCQDFDFAGDVPGQGVGADRTAGRQSFFAAKQIDQQV